MGSDSEDEKYFSLLSLGLLKLIKSEYPHLRLGQILCNALIEGTDSASLFYAEDDEVLRRLEKFHDTLKSQEKKDAD